MRFSKTLVSVVLLLIAGFAIQATAQSNSDSIKNGNAKYEQAQYEAAIEEYQKVTPTSGQAYAHALHNIGVCYYELWRTEDAIAMYQKAIVASHGRYAQAAYSLGVALEDLKRLTEAKAAYRQAIDSQDKFAPASFRLGVVAFNENDFEAASQFFKDAIAHSQDRLPASHNNLGVILARSGNLQAAEKEFATALRQTKGTLREAKLNLERCRSLLDSRVTAYLLINQ